MERFLGTVVIAVVTFQQVAAIATVPHLNISQYLGRWYQVYGDFIVDNFIETDCKCSTADYGIFPNGSISVFNACRLNTPKGQLDTIKGYADRPDEKEEGRLVVNLEGVPFSGDYWVVQLGPGTFNGSYYQYAVVTDRREVTVFVLARNVTEYREIYHHEVGKRLKKQGFILFYNKPTETYQGDDCIYVTPSSRQYKHTDSTQL